MARLVIVNENDAKPRKTVKDLPHGTFFTAAGADCVFIRTDVAGFPVVRISDNAGRCHYESALDWEVEHDLGIPKFKIES